jgi:hypothetical protein
MAYSRFMAHYWSLWAFLLTTGFLVPEIWMLMAGRPQDTLSAQIWRLEQFSPGQSIWAWNAFHFLFIGGLLLLDLWLLGHFGFGKWT